MKKNKILLIVLLMVIGFAAVSTTLVLNGTLNIGFNNPEFDVYFSNAIENGVENKKLIKDDTHIEFTKDMTLKDETYTLDYDVTNGSKNYDASLTINCTESNEYIEITNVFDTDTNLLATETRSGTLTIKVVKPYVGTEEEPTKSIEISCSITGTPVERDEMSTGTPADKVKQSNWSITEDNDNNGELSKGDLITLGTESFYVYDIEGDNVKAISQYNLYVGNSCTSNNSSSCSPLENPTGLQDSRAIGHKTTQPYIGVLAYDSTYSYDYDTSEIKPYVEEYTEKLKEMDTNITTDKVRLITKEELEKTGCNSFQYSCSSAPSYIYSTSYWTSSIESGYMWGVRSSGQYGRNDVGCDYLLGVRPVIELSKTLF